MNLESPATNPSPVHDAADLLKDTEDLLQYGTWIWTPDTGAMQFSKGMYRLLGYPVSAGGTVFLQDFLRHLGAERDKFEQYLHACIETGLPFRTMNTMLSLDGHSVRVLTKGKLLRQGDKMMVLAASQDFSQLPHLHEDMSQHRKLMDQYEIFLKFGTWQYSVATNELSWSTGMFSLFGYDPIKDGNLQITEHIYEKHVDPEDYSKGVLLRKGVTTDGKSEYFWQYRITTTNGERKWLETYGHSSRDIYGRYLGTFGITRDITNLKVYEHSLELKIRELNRSNAELEEFAYVASHDMQEPLRKLMTFSERLTAKYSNVLQDEGKLYIDRMQAATNNMRMLIDNLLDFSRIARTGEAFEQTDLNDVLQKTLADLEVPIEETQAVITSDKLPSIEAQATLMKQLFTNVISNAIKFRQQNIPPQISIQCHQLSTREAEELKLEGDNKYFRIAVKDNGIGFEPEYEQRIFQIFQRLHGKAEYPGSGIGLAICKKIVDYHNGVIYAQGQLNQGATIIIVLPEKQ
jgi:signal transduction histidine kinase